jgi:hypothetical protein
MERNVEWTDKRTDVSTNGSFVIYKDKCSFFFDFMILEIKVLSLFETPENAYSQQNVIF